MNADDWNSHWDRYSASAARNPAQALRRELIFSRLKLKAASDARLLDLGSGQGDFAREVLERFPSVSVLGLDSSDEGVKGAQRKVPAARFVQRDLSVPHAPDPAGWATHAVCSEVLEHLDDPVSFLKHAASWCAPGCVLVVTVPGGPQTAFDRHLGHRRHFTPESLRHVLTEAGLTVERITAAGFPFFNLYRLVVLLRGKRLIDDAAKPSGLACFAMDAFRVLFRFNSPTAPWGWQLVARARFGGR